MHFLFFFTVKAQFNVYVLCDIQKQKNKKTTPKTTSQTRTAMR